MSATDRYSHQLLYATVRQRLLDDIAQGVYQAGQQIPTENELCTQYNVSRITIRKAISDLVADGVLIRWQGKGTFVQSQNPAMNESPAPMVSITVTGSGA